MSTYDLCSYSKEITKAFFLLILKLHSILYVKLDVWQWIINVVHNMGLGKSQK